MAYEYDDFQSHSQSLFPYLTPEEAQRMWDSTIEVEMSDVEIDRLVSTVLARSTPQPGLPEEGDP